MLRAVGAGPALVACSTCRFARERACQSSGVSGGALLIARLVELQSADPRYSLIEVQENSCLFACRDFCAVHLRAPGKIGYVLGRFDPCEDAARALLDFAAEYAASDDGTVDFARWPEGVKGHFITRVPPSGHVIED